jgi:hypothetical protein
MHDEGGDGRRNLGNPNRSLVGKRPIKAFPPFSEPRWCPKTSPKWPHNQTRGVAHQSLGLPPWSISASWHVTSTRRTAETASRIPRLRCRVRHFVSITFISFLIFSENFSTSLTRTKYGPETIEKDVRRIDPRASYSPRSNRVPRGKTTPPQPRLAVVEPVGIDREILT